VQGASGTSPIVGKGTLLLPLDGGTYFQALHAPHFSQNILSVGLLSRSFDLVFSSAGSPDVTSCCTLRHKGELKTLFETEIRDVLYSLTVQSARRSEAPSATLTRTDLSTRKPGTSHGDKTFSRSKDLLMHWHRRTEYHHPARYLQLAKQFKEIPLFPIEDLKNLVCFPCQTAKAHRAPVARSSTSTTARLELVHLDISGTVAPSLGGSRYALGIIDDYTSKSDVYALETKSELTNVL